MRKIEEVKEFIAKEIERYEIDFTFAKKNENSIEMFYNEGAMNSLKDTLEHIGNEDGAS